MGALWRAYNNASLILRIFIGLSVGIGLGLAMPEQLKSVQLLGEVFVGALKGVAPVLVFVLVMSSLMQAAKGVDRRFYTTVILYLVSMLFASLLAVGASFLFPSRLEMKLASSQNPPAAAEQLRGNDGVSLGEDTGKGKAADGVSLGPVEGGALLSAGGKDVSQDPAVAKAEIAQAEARESKDRNAVMSSLAQQEDAVGAVAIVTQESVGEVVRSLLKSAIASPIDALLNSNYISILFWSVFLGMIMHNRAKQSTKDTFRDICDASLQMMYRIINLAPFGVVGLAYTAVSTSSSAKMAPYGHLIYVLVGCMLVMCFVINPLISFILLGKNPYPLVWMCLKRSAMTAFATRSSAANIPVNMGLCRRLGLDEDVYSITIPLGATIHMNGAAITITVMTMAVAYTLGMEVTILQAVLLAVVAALGACGSSGVMGGSLLLLPMACAFLGIPNHYAMQAVGVGFIIAVVEESFETALNSVGDVLMTATAENYERKRKGEDFELIPE